MDTTAKPKKEESEKEVKVPKALEKLVRLLCKAFYDPDKIIVVNALLTWHCVKRPDLETLLKYSKNSMEAALNTLKSDQIIKNKNILVNGSMEDCWHVNYGGIVNIIRFKLYKVQAKIQEEQKLETSRASFTCENCGKMFTELQMDRLMGPDFFMTQILSCTHCKGRVIENEKDDASDKRNLAEQFNEQRKKFDELLFKLEGVRLHEDLCNPQKCIDIPHLIEARAIQDAKDRVNDLRKGLVSPINDLNGLDIDNPNMQKQWRTGLRFDDSKMYENNLEIQILSYAEQKRKQALANQVAKEVPVWMKVSTVLGGNKDAEIRKESEVRNLWDDWYDDEDDEDMFDEDEEIGKRNKVGGGRWAQKRNEEVQKMCFQFEKKKDEADESDSDDSDSDDEMSYQISFPERKFNNFSYKDILMNPNCFHLLDKTDQTDFKRFLEGYEYPSDKITFLTNIS